MNFLLLLRVVRGLHEGCDCREYSHDVIFAKFNDVNA